MSRPGEEGVSTCALRAGKGEGRSEVRPEVGVGEAKCSDVEALRRSVKVEGSVVGPRGGVVRHEMRLCEAE